MKCGTYLIQTSHENTSSMWLKSPKMISNNQPEANHTPREQFYWLSFNLIQFRVLQKYWPKVLLSGSDIISNSKPWRVRMEGMWRVDDDCLCTDSFEPDSPVNSVLCCSHAATATVYHRGFQPDVWSTAAATATPATTAGSQHPSVPSCQWVLVTYLLNPLLVCPHIRPQPKNANVFCSLPTYSLGPNSIPVFSSPAPLIFPTSPLVSPCSLAIRFQWMSVAFYRCGRPISICGV